jgi:hypothetical protein
MIEHKQLANLSAIKDCAFWAKRGAVLPYLRQDRANDQQSCRLPIARLNHVVCWCLHEVAGRRLGFSGLASTLHSFRLSLWLWTKAHTEVRF